MLTILYVGAALQALVFLVVIYLLVQRGLRHIWQSYTNGRIRRFRPHVLGLLVDLVELSPLTSGLRPLDRAIIENLLLQQAEELRGTDREHMTLAFEKMGYVEEKVARLRSARWWRRVEATSKLGIMRSRDSIGVLLEASGDPVEDVRLASVRSLGEMNDTRGLKFLFQAMEDASHWAPERVAEVILTIGPAASMAVREQLRQTTNPMARLLLIRLAGLLRDVEAVEPLLHWLEDSDKETRRAAVRALGEIGDPSSLDKLLVALKDSAWEVRAEAALALGLFQDIRAIGALGESLKDSRLEVRYNAASALYRAGEEGVKLLQATAESDDPLAAGIATQILAEGELGLESVHV